MVSLLASSGANKDVASRLKRFMGWLDAHQAPWYAPDLAAYRAELLAALPRPARRRTCPPFARATRRSWRTTPRATGSLPWPRNRPPIP
ncbi:MAG TPA: hypothetical protein PKH77_06350 [Anaerolineae bacterium]|nr:hypothetical protein [Anaerolineae bacterium]